MKKIELYNIRLCLNFLKSHHVQNGLTHRGIEYAFCKLKILMLSVYSKNSIFFFFLVLSYFLRQQ